MDRTLPPVNNLTSRVIAFHNEHGGRWNALDSPYGDTPAMRPDSTKHTVEFNVRLLTIVSFQVSLFFVCEALSGLHGWYTLSNSAIGLLRC